MPVRTATNSSRLVRRAGTTIAPRGMVSATISSPASSAAPAGVLASMGVVLLRGLGDFDGLVLLGRHRRTAVVFVVGRCREGVGGALARVPALAGQRARS